MATITNDLVEQLEKQVQQQQDIVQNVEDDIFPDNPSVTPDPAGPQSARISLEPPNGDHYQANGMEDDHEEEEVQEEEEEDQEEEESDDVSGALSTTFPTG